ncbi:Exopolysaccharide biosynthesis glycosyltransferase EpsF [Fimbriiglobus ruber]|uniref:Exopolysaccharide biosynthesis glycosyltransferase EpsF n=2 Tax=Fimbriiglobus ruber TaxID=1908690 RepID=A0A225DP48_9BACT|nr:Exopolysaccharide biosynthesis glycosyltransferase EpsF [Fimbriiglobus ruber]
MTPDPVPGTRPVRVMVVSLLFNWPSTGGGNVHTAELTKYLAAAGYDVRHLYARFEPWGIGRVTDPTPYPAEAIEFSPSNWTAPEILARFRQAIDQIDPDWVILTDSWNLKPLMAEVAGGRPYILRLQALECLCPLNNVRLVPDDGGRLVQCTRHQLATPGECRRCVRSKDYFSGELHRAERELSGVGTAGYQTALFRAFEQARAVLVVNPLTAAMIEPYARDVRVVTSGMDPDRFPWPFPAERLPAGTPGVVRILFAGLTDEWTKGFHVLRDACAKLWRVRQDFELVVTGEALPEKADAFARYIGWQSQTDLPVWIAGVDVIAVPAVAQEALGRTAVEAMAAGRPVVASRLGGLPYTVLDGATGLLYTPGDATDLAAKLTQLLDDPDLRARLGTAGRRRFEEHYAWPVVIDTHYRPLLGPAHKPAERPVAEIIQPSESPSTDSAPLPKIGCVLAVRERPADQIERTLQTYRWQTYQPSDRVLLDFGSSPMRAAAYRDLCGRYGWRYLSTDPVPARWNSSTAYNLAVAALNDDVEVVFKSDADVLLSPNVLATAARFGRTAFCQFQYITVPRDTPCPANFNDPTELRTLFKATGKERASVGQGLFSCPVAWFHRVGGFDLNYRVWGYEDNDLRARAERSGPVIEVGWRDALLLHQWHQPSPDAGPAVENRLYFEYMREAGSFVRNDGRPHPPGFTVRVADGPQTSRPAPDKRWTVVVATRSTSDDLYQLSGEFLRFDTGGPTHRVRITGADATEYFRQLAALDANWVVNVAEDAFLLDPPGLMDLICRMDAGGYAACGVPDGGVIPGHRHNPVACSALFNVFDLRRVGPVWADWDRVRNLRHRPEFERAVAPFANRTAFQFDNFWPYYGVFFSLLEAGEKILYLDAAGWQDGLGTIVHNADGRELLLRIDSDRPDTSDVAIHRRGEATEYARQCQARRVVFPRRAYQWLA